VAIIDEQIANGQVRIFYVFYDIGKELFVYVPPVLLPTAPSEVLEEVRIDFVFSEVRGAFEESAGDGQLPDFPGGGVNIIGISPRKKRSVAGDGCGPKCAEIEYDFAFW